MSTSFVRFLKTLDVFTDSLTLTFVALKRTPEQGQSSRVKQITRPEKQLAKLYRLEIALIENET